MSNSQLNRSKPEDFATAIKRLASTTALCSVVLFSTVNSAAASSTGNTTFQVTATVAKSCTISATTMAFANYVLAVLDAISTITMTCTKGTNYVISLDKGTGVGATFANRIMQSASGNALNYSLYTDAGRNTVWGDGTSGSSTVSGTGTGAAQSIQVFGRIPANQAATVGSYNDTVNAAFTVLAN